MRHTVILAVCVITALVGTPVRSYAQQETQAQEHGEHHPDAAKAPGGAAAAPAKMAGMMAADAKLDELVKKMNGATGKAKTDAMAELLTALVENHHSMHGPMMANMMSMMKMMGGMKDDASSPAPAKK